MSQQEIVLVDAKEEQQQTIHQQIKIFLLQQAPKQRVKGIVTNMGPIHTLKIGMFEGRSRRVMNKSDYFSDRA